MRPHRDVSVSRSGIRHEQRIANERGIAHQVGHAGGRVSRRAHRMGGHRDNLVCVVVADAAEG